jgi:hypothetical protein
MLAIGLPTPDLRQKVWKHEPFALEKTHYGGMVMEERIASRNESVKKGFVLQ